MRQGVHVLLCVLHQISGDAGEGSSVVGLARREAAVDGLNGTLHSQSELWNGRKCFALHLDENVQFPRVR